MLYILTKSDLATLGILSGNEYVEKSPMQDIDDVFLGNEDVIKRSAMSLRGVALAKEENGQIVLAIMGQMLAERLCKPQSVVSTVRTSVNLNGPVSYCFFGGLWAAITPDATSDLQYIFFPMRTSEAMSHARENLLSGYKIKNYKPFEVKMNLKETAVFQLSQMLINERVERRGKALDRDETWFTARGLFTHENLKLLADCTIVSQNIELVNDLATALCDPKQNADIFMSLVNKGIFDTDESSTNIMRFRHSDMSRQWLTADGLLDSVLINCEGSENKTAHYLFREEGILEVLEQNGSIIYKTVQDIDIYSFFTVDDIRNKEVETKTIKNMESVESQKNEQSE